jgi:hypothetical protein
MCITPTCVLSARAINQLFVEPPVTGPGEGTLGLLKADYNIRKATNSDQVNTISSNGEMEPVFPKLYTRSSRTRMAPALTPFTH